jgi:hypothetical protein
MPDGIGWSVLEALSGALGFGPLHTLNAPTGHMAASTAFSVCGGPSGARNKGFHLLGHGPVGVYAGAVAG